MSENPGPKKGAKKVPEKAPQPLSIPIISKDVDEKQKLLEKTLVIFSEQVTTQVMQLAQIVATLGQKLEMLERTPHNDIPGVIREMGVIFQHQNQSRQPEIDPIQMLALVKQFMPQLGQVEAPPQYVETPDKRMPPKLVPPPPLEPKSEQK